MAKINQEILISLLVLGGGMGLLSFLEDRTQDSVLPPLKVPAVLEAEGQRYEATLPQGSSVLDLMKEAEKETDFSFSGREFLGLGFFVEEINGKRQNPKEREYWIYSVNGEKAQIGVSLYELKAYDVISWSYEKEE